MLRFIAGAIAGGVAVWVWDDDVRAWPRRREEQGTDQIQGVRRALGRITTAAAR